MEILNELLAPLRSSTLEVNRSRKLLLAGRAPTKGGEQGQHDGLAFRLVTAPMLPLAVAVAIPGATAPAAAQGLLEPFSALAARPTHRCAPLAHAKTDPGDGAMHSGKIY